MKNKIACEVILTCKVDFVVGVGHAVPLQQLPQREGLVFHLQTMMMLVMKQNESKTVKIFTSCIVGFAFFLVTVLYKRKFANF